MVEILIAYKGHKFSSRVALFYSAFENTIEMLQHEESSISPAKRVNRRTDKHISISLSWTRMKEKKLKYSRVPRSIRHNLRGGMVDEINVQALIFF